MRLLVLICLALLMTNCEDTQSKRKNETKSITKSTSSKPKEKTKKAIKKPERKYPRLTDSTAMDFFLEYEKEHPEYLVRLYTDYGNIDIKLHRETKFHRANFIFLTKQNYFENTQFYRVVKNFIIQGGSSDEQFLAKRRAHIGKYLLPTDTKRGFTHKRGAVSMPSSDIDNPHKLASPYQFFIMQKDARYLDGDYTIFGQVVKGLDVVDKIANQPTDDYEWPTHNIYINKVEILK